jgi:hypothetical protein
MFLKKPKLTFDRSFPSGHVLNLIVETRLLPFKESLLNSFRSWLVFCLVIIQIFNKQEFENKIS